MPKNESRDLGKLKNEFNMMVTAAVKQEDGTSPSVHSSFLYTFKSVRDITLRDLYGILSGNNNLNKKISFDIENKTLIAIRISALNLDNEKTIIDIKGDEDLKRHVSNFFQFLSGDMIVKLIFRLNKVFQPKIFNCPIHGHIK